MSFPETLTSNAFWIAFGLTLFAGLSTGIGSAVAFFARTTNKRLLSLALGFSGGVMIYVSLVEIFTKARRALETELGLRAGYWSTVIAFFGGMFVIALIDKLIPSYENPHEMHRLEDIDGKDASGNYEKLQRMGLFTALAIAIHNFPEGLATFTAALREPVVGIPIAVAIAVHNIPEGMAVSVPIYYATKSRGKAFAYSFLSGLSEPVGALLGFLILRSVMSDTVFGVLFGSVAGIMVFISLDQLLPSAEKYGEHHLCIYGLVSGMAVMALSLLLFV